GRGRWLRIRHAITLADRPIVESPEFTGSWLARAVLLETGNVVVNASVVLQAVCVGVALLTVLHVFIAGAEGRPGVAVRIGLRITPGLADFRWKLVPAAVAEAGERIISGGHGWLAVGVHNHVAKQGIVRLNRGGKRDFGTLD